MASPRSELSPEASESPAANANLPSPSNDLLSAAPSPRSAFGPIGTMKPVTSKGAGAARSAASSPLLGMMPAGLFPKRYVCDQKTKRKKKKKKTPSQNACQVADLLTFSSFPAEPASYRLKRASRKPCRSAIGQDRPPVATQPRCARTFPNHQPMNIQTLARCSSTRARLHRNRRRGVREPARCRLGSRQMASELA